LDSQLLCFTAAAASTNAPLALDLYFCMTRFAIFSDCLPSLSAVAMP
jgi:hypothetical protein